MLSQHYIMLPRNWLIPAPHQVIVRQHWSICPGEQPIAGPCPKNKHHVSKQDSVERITATARGRGRKSNVRDAKAGRISHRATENTEAACAAAIGMTDGARPERWRAQAVAVRKDLCALGDSVANHARRRRPGWVVLLALRGAAGSQREQAHQTDSRQSPEAGWKRF